MEIRDDQIAPLAGKRQLKNVRGGGFAVDNLEFREPGVDCEMCHGPSETHVIEMNLGERYPKPPLSPPVNFHELGAGDSVRICAQCHMQSAIREPAAGGELNYALSGSFAPENRSIPFGEFARKGFYKDGRYLDTIECQLPDDSHVLEVNRGSYSVDGHTVTIAVNCPFKPGR